eukprot:m.319078 g.319078  ORF g.319078 m.319078 type:complete len:368 (+) comp27584_c1_seq1:274-1377(+)
MLVYHGTVQVRHVCGHCRGRPDRQKGGGRGGCSADRLDQYAHVSDYERCRVAPCKHTHPSGGHLHCHGRLQAHHGQVIARFLAGSQVPQRVVRGAAGRIGCPGPGAATAVPTGRAVLRGIQRLARRSAALVVPREGRRDHRLLDRQRRLAVLERAEQRRATGHPVGRAAAAQRALHDPRRQAHLGLGGVEELHRGRPNHGRARGCGRLHTRPRDVGVGVRRRDDADPGGGHRRHRALRRVVCQRDRRVHTPREEDRGVRQRLPLRRRLRLHRADQPDRRPGAGHPHRQHDGHPGEGEVLLLLQQGHVRQRLPARREELRVLDGDEPLRRVHGALRDAPKDARGASLALGDALLYSPRAHAQLSACGT